MHFKIITSIFNGIKSKALGFNTDHALSANDGLYIACRCF